MPSDRLDIPHQEGTGVGTGDGGGVDNGAVMEITLVFDSTSQRSLGK